MRAIWKGAISFGLVNVPVKLYAATEDHDVGLHQVHDKDGGRIRYQRRCEVCGKVVEYEHIDKAFDDGSTTVVLTEEDLKSLPEERSRETRRRMAIPHSQAATSPSPLQVPLARQTEEKQSCSASATASWSLHRRRSRAASHGACRS